MTLSELAYHVVKNVKYYEDPGFTLASFRAGDFDADPDYANSINNALAPINEAIHRLSDRNKLQCRVATLGEQLALLADISSVPMVKRVRNAFFMTAAGYERVGFRELNRGQLLLDSLKSGTFCIEYWVDVPNLQKQWSDNLGNYIAANDPDLSQFGVNETMCGYVVEYAQGKLLEPIAPELANMHVTRAEQYFDDLEEPSTPFNQPVVERKFGIKR